MHLCVAFPPRLLSLLQVVAVKKLHRMERQLTEQFLLEIALMKFCR